MLDESLGVPQSQCLTMIDLKNQIIHIRDTDIWWLQDESPAALIELAGGRLAEADEEPTIIVGTSSYNKLPANESYIHEDDFWPECIKQAFPDYLKRCNQNYWVSYQESYNSFLFSKEEVIDHVKDALDDWPDFLNIECFDLIINDYTPILYVFWNESLATEGYFVALDSESQINLYENSELVESHLISIQIQ